MDSLGLEQDWLWIDASRVSLDNSSHQLHERQTGQLEQWRLSSYSWRPDGLLLGLAQRAWQWFKPYWRKRANTPGTVAATPPQEHPDALPGHSQR